MQKLRTASGFSLIEMMVVVGIIGIMTVMAGPVLRNYGVRESARTNAQNIAALLSNTRARAIDLGQNHYIVFQTPVTFLNPAGPRLPIAQVVQDVDGNWTLAVGIDVVRNVFAAPDSRLAVTPYGVGVGVGGTAPYAASGLPPEDVAGAAALIGNLGAIVNGTTFPIANGFPTVGFTPRGIPVDITQPTNPGSGAGAFYVTDNNNLVYAVVLLPLGGVRVRVFEPNTGAWL